MAKRVEEGLSMKVVQRNSFLILASFVLVVIGVSVIMGVLFWVTGPGNRELKARVSEGQTAIIDEVKAETAQLRDEIRNQQGGSLPDMSADVHTFDVNGFSFTIPEGYSVVTDPEFVLSSRERPVLSFAPGSVLYGDVSSGQIDVYMYSEDNLKDILADAAALNPPAVISRLPIGKNKALNATVVDSSLGADSGAGMRYFIEVDRGPVVLIEISQQAHLLSPQAQDDFDAFLASITETD